jgi:outer membrane protein assembly factor BamD
MKVEAPDTLYEEAAREHADGNYELAVQKYRELLDHYPLDPRAEEVELRIAHAHMANEAYPEAIAAFSDFQRMHPTSPHLPEVEYRIGEAYVAQIDTIDRDLGAARNAHQRLQSVLARYPRSEFRKDVEEKLRFVREHLAGRELYIAEYYFDRDQYPAGWVRTSILLSQFPETGTAADAAERLEKAAEAQGDDETARLASAAAQELGPQRTEEAEEGPGALRSPGPALEALRAHLRSTTPPSAPSA